MVVQLINGVEINLVDQGHGPALILLHGFTGSAAGWAGQLKAFSRDFRVIAIDALGHGLSDAPPDPGRYAFSRLGIDFVTILDRLELEQVSLLGYSMGGRMALYCALYAPGRISKLILESASPGLKTETERKARRESDNLLAEQIEREGLPSFVDFWEKLPLWRSQVQLPPEVRGNLRAERLKNQPLGLANSLRGAGSGMQPSLWEQLEALETQVLLVAGELDRKFCEIAGEMHRLLPASRLAVIPGAGHTVHLERPAKFNQLVLDFLKGDF